MSKVNEYEKLLEYLKENEDKLRVFLSADERMKLYRMRLKGKKSSRTIFMSDELQFLMNEYCIENDMKIGEFVELAIVEHLNRCGMDKKLKNIISSDNGGEQGKIEKQQVGTDESTGGK